MLNYLRSSVFALTVHLAFKVLSDREQASERCSNATNGKIRTLYILMMYSHCRVTTRAKSIATVIARIGHFSNLTTHNLYRSDSVEITVLSRAVWKLYRVASSHQEKHASLRHRIALVWNDLKGPFTHRASDAAMRLTENLEHCVF